jgi:hypothetical protein
LTTLKQHNAQCSVLDIQIALWVFLHVSTHKGSTIKYQTTAQNEISYFYT